jgi:predicted DNA binding CopG/RHH family protein
LGDNNKAMSKNSFDHLTDIPKPKKETESAPRFFAVRLSNSDGMRFKHAAERNGFTNQKALVEAINRLMSEWGEASVADIGSGGKGRK